MQLEKKESQLYLAFWETWTQQVLSEECRLKVPLLGHCGVWEGPRDMAPEKQEEKGSCRDWLRAGSLIVCLSSHTGRCGSSLRKALSPSLWLFCSLAET